MELRFADALGASAGAMRRLAGAATALVKLRAAPRLVEGVLALLLGVLGALIALKLFAPLPTPKGDIVAAVAPSASGAISPSSVNPFRVEAESSIVEAAPSSAPNLADTTLDLTLTGVWASPEGGSATIQTPDGRQQRFGVGEEIVGGVTLEAVYADQVTINRRGVRESLRFISKTGGASVPPRAASSNNTAPGEAGQRTGSSPGGGITTALTGRLSEFMRLAPARDENGALVIDIYAARNRTLFNAAGLKDGDRLVSINGSPPPTTPAALRGAMNALDRDGMAVFTVRRDGKDIPITVDLEALGKMQ